MEARTGQMTIMDRWAAHEHRRSDRLLSGSKELYRLRPLVPADPVQGPGGITAVIWVGQAGAWWNGHPPVKMSVRLPSEVSAYRVAAQLVTQFQAEGPTALQRPRIDAA